MNNNISTKFQWILEIRGKESVIYNQNDSFMRVCNFCECFYVNDFEGRICWCFNPNKLFRKKKKKKWKYEIIGVINSKEIRNYFGIWFESFFNSFQIIHFNKCTFNSDWTSNFIEVSISSSINIINGNDMIPSFEGVHNCSSTSGTRGECKTFYWQLKRRKKIKQKLKKWWNYKTIPCFPPSRVATANSKLSLVGFPERA